MKRSPIWLKHWVPREQYDEAQKRISALHKQLRDASIEARTAQAMQREMEAELELTRFELLNLREFVKQRGMS